jgi:hypothetical protein
MLWHGDRISKASDTEEYPAEGMVAQPIEFMFRDALVWKHSDMHPNDFEYIESHLKEARNIRNPIRLDMIDDNTMFLQLKEFWKQETSDGLSDIDANELHSFLQAAIFLGIRGDACKRFTRNMARIGLLGTHSQNILGRMSEYLLRGKEMCWELLLAFAAELECEVQVSGQTAVLCPTGPRYGTVLKTKPEIDANELRVVPDVFGRNKNVGTHMAYSLVWFLWHLDLHELNLRDCKMNKNDVDALSQALFRAEDLGLQAMNVRECYMSSGSLAAILPYLKYLTKLYAAWNNLNEADCGAFAACTLLTELDIGYCFMAPGSIAKILPHLKNLTKLYANDNRLNEADRDALAACTLLTELNIKYCFENSPGSITRILPYLKDLTKLDAYGNRLNEADCGAFAACTLLTELNIRLCFENSPGYLATVLPHLKNLTKLDAGGNSLNNADCRAFATCTLLTELNIRGCFEDSPGYLAIILPHLKNLTKLRAHDNDLNEEDCRALTGCTLLTELNIEYCFGDSPGSIAKILSYLENLTELNAYGNDLNEEDRMAVKAARRRGIKVYE